MLVIQPIPHAWKRDEAALRRFAAAVLWIPRTGAPWRDLPEILDHRLSVYHRLRRWCVRGWWELVFGQPRPAVPVEGLVVVDSATCKAHNPAPRNKPIYVQRHHVENLFVRLEDQARIALRRDKMRRSWMSLAHPAATMINLRFAVFSHTAQPGMLTRRNFSG